MEKIKELKRKDATHRLACRHSIGRSGFDYYMDCTILKRTNAGKLKLLVFGERYWKGYDDKKRIRYVDEFRVSPKEELTA